MMSGQLDISMPPALLIALSIGILQPLYLFALTRISGLRDHNALQFLLSVAIMVALWVGAVLSVSSLRSTSFADIALSLMVLGSGMLFYLEIWGLLSRGYTLGILLTLLKAGCPLNEKEISSGYRGGEGLDWIMRHRLAGLIAAGLVEHQGDQVLLTPVRGLVIARLYQAGIIAVGLHKTQ
jgi:hypothetical protein